MSNQTLIDQCPSQADLDAALQEVEVTAAKLRETQYAYGIARRDFNAADSKASRLLFDLYHAQLAAKRELDK